MSAAQVLSGWDTRYQAGEFIKAAWSRLTVAERASIENAVLALDSDLGKHAKPILARCIPGQAVATSEMLAFKQSLATSGEQSSNIPPIRFTSSSRPYDTDAYLEFERVGLTDAPSLGLRALIKTLEELPSFPDVNAITLEGARQYIDAIRATRTALEALGSGSVHKKLYDLTIGSMAQTAATLARAPTAIMNAFDVRPELEAALLMAADAGHPPFDQEHEDGFQVNLSWSGPSARTSAASGLILLIREDQTANTPAMAAVRKLARDRVCHVRLQILERIHLASRVDQAWVWSEIEHVLRNEPTRGVVGGALRGLGNVGRQDLPRTVRLCRELIARYAGKVELGMEERRHDAATMICDIHMTANNGDATQFIEDTITTLSDPKLVESWVPRYSDMLLLGDPDDLADEKHALRAKSLALYRDILASTLRDMNDLDCELDLAKATTWNEADREKLQALFGILDDMTMRLYFASGGSSSDEEQARNATRRIRLYAEARPLLEGLAEVFVPRVAYHLIQALENLIPIDPPGVFSLIARTVKAAEKGGYAQEPMAAELIVRIVERYLADHRDIFAGQQQLAGC